jgi:putative ABC transport system ATP-binding protein
MTEPDRAAGPSAPASREPGDAGPRVLTIRSLSKSFGSRRLLHALDLDVRTGETVALMGESGAGKSTLLNIVAGLEPADAGRIDLLGETLPRGGPDASADLRRRRIGFVFQAFHLIAYLPAWQNVAVPLMLLGVDRSEAQTRAHDWLARVGVADRAGAFARDLSGGEQQRVAIARALVHGPALVLADEPTGNLDPATAERVLALLGQAVRESGAAMLMVTHSPRAAGLADRRLRLADGRLSDVTHTSVTEALAAS